MGHILGDPTTPLKVTSVLKPFLPPPCFSCPCCFSLSKPPALHTPPALRAPRPSAVLCPPAPAAQGQDAGDRPRPWSLPSQATRDHRTSVCSLCAYLLATKVPLPVCCPQCWRSQALAPAGGGGGLSLMGQHCPRQRPHDWFGKAGPWRLLNIFSTVQIWAPCRRSINNR